MCAVHGDQRVRCVYVGGDVPKPGPVNFEDMGMTVDAALAGTGFDLSPFYVEGRSDDEGARCPIRVVILRQGEKTTYNPSVHAVAIQAHPLELYDAIAVTDFRQHPRRIEARKQRIDRMLELGSTEIGDELLALATLRHEYDVWRGDGVRARAASALESLGAEATRLVEAGKGKKIIGLLDLRLSALRLDGLGHAHPTVKSTLKLRQLFRDLTTK